MTAGTWTYSAGQIRSTSDGQPIRLRKQSILIADVSPAFKTSREMIANGMLMAAAPELLAALETAMAHLDYEYVPDDVWTNAAIAIEKAKGNQ